MAVCVDLLFTYPLVFAPGREIIENALVHEGDSWINLRRNAIRTVLVMVTFGFAQVRRAPAPCRAAFLCIVATAPGRRTERRSSSLA